MDKVQRTAFAFVVAGACVACGSNHPPADGTGGAVSSASSTTSAGGRAGTATASAGRSSSGGVQTRTPVAGKPAAAPNAGAAAAGTAGLATATAGELAGAGGKATAAGTGGASGSAGAARIGATNGPVTPLPMEPMDIDLTNDTKRRFGAPHVAVNPSDSNNIVVLASSDLGYTRDCVPAEPGSDCEIIAADGFILTQPRGFYKTPGFMDIGVYTTFDRGVTWKKADLDHVVPPDDPKVRARGEGPIAAMADGTFYVGFNAIDWGEWESQPMSFFPNGGVGVMKSTDGGLTWNWTSYSFTPADWPYGGNDLSTGEFFVTSGLAGISNLGPRSNGKADSQGGSITDRWISSTKDGVTWTEPQPLGGSRNGTHVPGSHSHVAAANGIMATMFLSSDSSSCSFFVESATTPCVVFQTTTDAGKTWNRHRVPTPADFAPGALSILLGADPTKKGHFSAVLLNETGRDIRVYNTPDSGETWGEPAVLAQDGMKTSFSPWAGYSAKGKLGVMWRTYENDPGNPAASAPYKPYSVWAAISNDGGATFSQPLKMSKNNSPAPPNDPNDSFSIVGDHGPSGIALDDDNGVYVVWADWTSGERSIHFSAVNAQAFKP